MKFLSTSLLLISLICTPVMADYTPGITSEPCVNGLGYITIANNGTAYCVSHKKFNWWSAMSWCQAVGMELISYPEDCICAGEKCPQAQCPNMKGILKNMGDWYFTKSWGINIPVVIQEAGDIMVREVAGYGNPTRISSPAVCKMP